MILFTTKDLCAKVIICAGSNVADNCCILPGGIIGKNAVLASNSLCPEGRYLPEGSVWLGSTGCEPTCLKQGDESSVDSGGTIIMASAIQQDVLCMIGDESTLRPFGKAYLRNASYFVWTLEMIISFTAIVKIIISIFHTLPLLLAYRYGWLFLAGNNHSTTDISGGIIYITTLLIYLCTHQLRIILWFIIELIVKWSIIGRRKEGQYNYDMSSYGQRWELYQIIVSSGRRLAGMNLMDFINGTSFMSTWLRWNGATIGKDCCLYPAGKILFNMIGFPL